MGTWLQAVMVQGPAEVGDTGMKALPRMLSEVPGQQRVECAWGVGHTEFPPRLPGHSNTQLALTFLEVFMVTSQPTSVHFFPASSL